MSINSMSAYPKTYTDLFLRPAKEVFDRLSVVEQYPFEYDLSIPVSPSVLNYKRDAGHTEVYSIVKGGMLERNLPGLWKVSVETYLPRDAWERAFHNRRIVKRSKRTNDTNFVKQQFYPQDMPDEKTGRIESCKFQQEFINYVNRLMDWKIPCQLWDESNPVRVQHQPLYFCIEHFDYKMLPHDDIEYTLDLIEWKEPKVRVSDVVSSEDREEETPPPVKGASGDSIMAFGYMDRRNHNDGRIYSADTVRSIVFSTGEVLRTLSSEIKDWTNVMQRCLAVSIRVPNGVKATNWQAHSNGVLCNVVIVINMPRALADASYSYATLKKEFPKEMAEIDKIYSQMLTGTRDDFTHNLRFVEIEEENNKKTKIQTLTGTPLTSKLGNDMWAKRLKTIKNMKAYYTEAAFESPKEDLEFRFINYNGYIMATTSTRFRIAVKEKVWYKTMYLLKPIAGKDKVYDPTYSYLCPLENTIVTPYQRYLNTFDASFTNGKGTDINSKSRKNGNNQYHAERDANMQVTNNIEPEVVTLKTGQKTLAEEIHKRKYTRGDKQ